MKSLILDGNNIIFRAWHTAKGEELVKGTNISPVTHFFHILKPYLEKFEPNGVYLAWDKRINPDGENFRKNLVPYKSNRPKDPEKFEAIFKCVDLITELCLSMGIKVMYPYNLEADDVIYYLDKELDGEKIIVSSDKDLLQLVSEHTTIYNTTKNKMVNVDNFEEFTGVALDRFVKYKAIMGDKSDNVAGLHRYGEVKSKKLAMSNDWSELTPEQLLIVERNIMLMDLTVGIDHSEGEEDNYKEQLKELEDSSKGFSTLSFTDICNNYNLWGLLRASGQWKSLLQRKNILEEWFAV